MTRTGGSRKKKLWCKMQETSFTWSPRGGLHVSHMTSHAITRQHHLLGQESKQTLRIRAVCIFTLGFWLLDVTWPWKLLNWFFGVKFGQVLRLIGVSLRKAKLSGKPTGPWRTPFDFPSMSVSAGAETFSHEASNNTIWVVSKSLTADIVPEAC